MQRKIQKLKISPLILVIMLLLLSAVMVQADEIKWIAVGYMHNWFSSAGCEIEVGRRHLVADQQDGLLWPALFRYQDCQAAKALWIGTTNYQDPIVNKTFPFKVAHIGTRAFDENNEFMPVTFKLYARESTPLVSVDGVLACNTTYLDMVDEVDPNLKSDRMIYNVVNTSVGITMTRRIYVNSQQYHDNYFVFDYVFKNTGIYDKNGSKAEKTLTDVIFFFQYRYAPSRESGPYGYYFSPQNSAWGRNSMNDVIGENPASGDPFRAMFSWYGRHSAWQGKTFGDALGAPNFKTDGHITAPQFVGVVTIHADKSTQDHTDDPLQPRTTFYFDSDGTTSTGNDQFNEAKMAAEYVDMTKGHPALSQAEAVGDGNADEWGDSPGGYSQVQGFGPYTLAPGDSVHIVMAEGAAGINRLLCYQIGDLFMNGPSPYDLPDGSTTTNANDFKNAWVLSGRDSILQTFDRAVNAYNSGFAIPVQPPAPSTFEVISGGDRIILNWGKNAETHPGFAGYRVFRAMHTPDTTFTEIFACGKGTENPTLVNSYDDVSAVRGFNYYYYIVSFDDGSNNNSSLNPGGSLQSSLFLTRTNEPAFLKRQPGDNLEAIRVVPNPYNINARDLQYGSSAPNRIMFLDIPPFCDIKIFTERGDLIYEIEHADGSGDAQWNLITTSRQTVVSGVYIAYIEVTQDYYDSGSGELLFKSGDHTIRKFAVIR